jgi:hypothetical protein
VFPIIILKKCEVILWIANSDTKTKLLWKGSAQILFFNIKNNDLDQTGSVDNNKTGEITFYLFNFFSLKGINYNSPGYNAKR